MWSRLLSIPDVEDAREHNSEPNATQEAPSKAEISSVDVYNACLYIGTSDGLLASYALDGLKPTLIETSTTKKNRSIASMFVLPNPGRLLVFTSSGAATGYTLPSLELAQGVAMRDVHGGCSLDEPSMAAVLSSSAIRVIKVLPDSGIQLVRTIDCQGATTICRVSGSLIGVGSSEGCFFVDASQTNKITPLVPSGPGMVPFVLPAGPDSVLVVQGMSLEELATGLVVNSSGDIQEGDVIVWEGYPKALATSSAGYAVAAVQGKLQINNLKTAKPIDTELNVEQITSITRLTEKVYGHSQELAAKLGGYDLIWADIALLSPKGIDVWFAPSKFLQLEQEILSGKQVTLDPLTASSEQGVAELEYLSLLGALKSLDPSTFKLKDALRHWTDGPRLDYHIVLYVYNLENDVPKVYPGLVELRDSLRSSQLDSDFLVAFLKAEYKRRIGPDQQTILTHYVPLLNNDDLARLGLSSKQRAAVLKEAEAQHRYAVLEHIYNVSGNNAELVKVWLRTVRGEWKRPEEEVQHSAKNLAKHLKRSTDTELVWDATLQLLRVDPELALSVFFERQAAISDADILDALKDATQSGDPWRKYLRHVVATTETSANKDYIADFTMLIVSDLLEVVDANQVEQWYKQYREQSWPRPDFWTWSVANQSKDYAAKLLDFWGSLLRDELELTSLLPVFEGPLACLKLERSAIFARLGLHEQAIELLVEIQDFRSLHWYSNYGEPLNPYSTSPFSGSGTPPPPSKPLDEHDPVRLDLHQLVFKLVATGTEQPGIIRELLKDSPLDLRFVLMHVSPKTPSSAISDFASAKLKERAYELQAAHLKYALEKQRSQLYS